MSAALKHWDGWSTPTSMPATDEPRNLAAEPVSAAEVEGWLALTAAGWPAADVADQSGVPVELVRQACAEAARAKSNRDVRSWRFQGQRVREPRVRLGLPPGPLTPRTRCPHDTRPIPKGEPELCLICHRSGLDGIHAALVRDPKTDPKPEPRPREEPKPELTRAQRRKMLAKLTESQRREDERAEEHARRFRRAKLRAERQAARS